MKRLLIPVILLAVLWMGCDGITIELPWQQQPVPVVVTPEPPEPTVPAREVLFFTQPGCPPCEAAKPRVEEMRAQGLRVTEIDIYEQPDLARQYNIVQTPTFVILEDGVEVERTSDIVLAITILVKILAWILPLLLG
jgi:thiol-disulfide isomerase/thioredoxin